MHDSLGTTVRRAWKESPRRTGAALVAAALTLLLTGDGGVRALPPAGIDPLDLLSLKVRPNAIIVLDSSGSMRDRTDSVVYTATLPSQGEVVGDEKNSKLYTAKQALKTVIQNNQTNVSFELGRYVQNAGSYGPAGLVYLYTTTDTNAAGRNIDGVYGITRNSAFDHTAGGVTTYHLFTGLYRVNRKYEIVGNGIAPCSETAIATPWPGTPPGADWRDAPPYIDVTWRGNATACSGGSTTVRFFFRGIRWIKDNGGAGACSGYDDQVALAACTDDAQFTTVSPYLGPEVIPPPDGTGNLTGLSTSNVTAPPTAIRASGHTPIAESLINIKANFDTVKWPAISPLTPKPRTFVIVVTGGDDTCADAGTFDLSNLDNNALRAAHKAQQLYAGVTADPESKVQTFVVALGAAASRSRANVIAWGGSGMALPTTGSGAAERWASAPTAADRANCTTCVDAFTASNAAELTNALQTAIDLGQSSGTFSDQQSITESIFEYVFVAPSPAPSPSPVPPPPDPMDPDGRYSATVPVLLQSTFDMPLYDGHLKAFRNVGTPANTSGCVSVSGSNCELWDAGAKLAQKLTTAMGAGNYRFDTHLHANTTAATIAASAAFIKRRIYTTTRAGVSDFLNSTAASIVSDLSAAAYFQPPEQITLWPPSTTPAPGVDPAAAATAGILDTALGLTSANYPTVLAFKQAFAACTVSPASALPAGITCTDTDSSGTANWDQARKEARQIVLAFMAGATLTKDTSGLAIRTTAASGSQIQFRARSSIMAESTLAAPAVSAPPLQANPQTHTAEYQLYRDGPRTSGGVAVNGINRGFGLRNPDKDGQPASAADVNLKPSISVVYHATNSMLHAFRGGPCPSSNCVGGAAETGGEELWAFVPHDQLGKLRLRMQTQTRDNHTYMLAAPIRFADVFVPGSFSTTIGGVTVSGDGVWRTVMIFGRGIAGKHLTALDVTTPGPFTRASLAANPPIHLWTRGNPDTQNLTAGGTKNNTTSGPTGTADFNAYAKMGETWSVPAVSFATAANNTTNRKSSGVEFVAYLGSGFSSVATEGSTFYTLDVLTGDVVASYDVGDRGGMGFENALVASAAAFQPSQLVSGFVGHPASAKTERIFIGDVHGRLWRFRESSPGVGTLLADLGSNQPIGNAAALLNYQGTQATNKPHIFVETGNDNRVLTAGNTFKMFGLRDDNLASDTDTGDGVAGPVKVLFIRDFPAGYRGLVQPATAYNSASPPSGVVFFAGVKFNPTSAAPSPPPCASSFDSVIFAFGAESGGAAYDFGGQSYVTMTGQRVQAIRGAGGQLVVDKGLQAQNPPPAPAPAAAAPPVPAPQANVYLGSAMSNPTAPYSPGDAIPGLLPFRLGSATCQ